MLKRTHLKRNPDSQEKPVCFKTIFLVSKSPLVFLMIFSSYLCFDYNRLHFETQGLTLKKVKFKKNFLKTCENIFISATFHGPYHILAS